MVARYTLPRIDAMVGQMERISGIIFNDLLTTQSNSLLPLSYLPISVDTQVFGVLIGEEKEVVISNYCDWDYLKNFWPEELLWIATYICNCESQGQPDRVNNSKYGTPELSIGLFQINIWAHPRYAIEEMKDPVKNIMAAIDIYNKEGWSAWYNCYKQIK
jgi:hypothetical protein